MVKSIKKNFCNLGKHSRIKLGDEINTLCNGQTECPNTYPYQNEEREKLPQNTNPVNRCYLSVAFDYPFFIRDITFLTFSVSKEFFFAYSKQPFLHVMSIKRSVKSLINIKDLKIKDNIEVITLGIWPFLIIDGKSKSVDIEFIDL